VVRVPQRVSQRLVPEPPTPERCVEGYYLRRTRFESLVNLIEGAHFMFRNPTAPRGAYLAGTIHRWLDGVQVSAGQHVKS
jgi:hypothetical protein